MIFKHLFSSGNSNLNCHLLPAFAFSLLKQNPTLHLWANGLLHTHSNRINSFLLFYLCLCLYIQNCFKEILHALLLYSHQILQ